MKLKLFSFCIILFLKIITETKCSIDWTKYVNVDSIWAKEINIEDLDGLEKFNQIRSLDLGWNQICLEYSC